jgi:hypothetical protein
LEIVLDFLYKYQAINDNTKDALKNNYLYFSKPSQLNDPFDSKFKLIWKSDSIEKTENWLAKYDPKPRTKNEIRAYHKKFNSQIVPQSSFDKLFDSLRILSLTTISNNLLMWSHYSDSHKGICLIIKNTSEDIGGIVFRNFDILKRYSADTHPGYLAISKVIYSKFLPYPVNSLDDDYLSKVYEATRMKSLDWEYEKEQRIITDKKRVKTQKVHYKPQLIEGIIFGIKTCDKHKEEIMDIAKKYLYPEINFFQAIKKEDEFGIEIHPI